MSRCRRGWLPLVGYGGQAVEKISLKEDVDRMKEGLNDICCITEKIWQLLSMLPSATAAAAARGHQ